LLETSLQLEVCTQSYGAPKLQKYRLWQFRNSHLGVSRQKAIWMWASWRGTEYTIRGKVVASPKSRPWWVLWVWVCPWLVLAPKMLQLCTNQLFVWVVQIEWMINCLSFFIVPSWSSSMPSTPSKCYEPRNMPCFSVVLNLDSHLSPLRSLGVRHFSMSFYESSWVLELSIGTNSILEFSSSYGY
jgi:hypothetical protein